MSLLLTQADICPVGKSVRTADNAAFIAPLGNFVASRTSSKRPRRSRVANSEESKMKSEHSSADINRRADRKDGLDRRGLLSGVAMLPALPSFLLGNTQSAAAQTNTGVSFAVYGDSRP